MRSFVPGAKKFHLYLGAFFAPLLLFFLITGCWQTLAPADDPDAPKNWFQNLMEPLTSVHTGDFFPPEKSGHSHLGFKLLVAAMAFGMVFSIGLGIYLAFRLNKKKWPVILAIALGVLVPAVLLLVDL